MEQTTTQTMSTSGAMHLASDSPTDAMLRHAARVDQQRDGGRDRNPAPEPDWKSSPADALRRAYSPYVPGPDSRMSDVQAVSDHIRRRRCMALLRGALDFSVKVMVVTAGIIIGVICQHGTPREPEAVRAPAEQVVPTGFDGRQPSDQSSPVIDNVTTTIFT